jgi:predicted nucleotidyltransferase
MDRVLGIIAEYNPFHNGHLYHLCESKAACGADTVVAVMSGDFVQRGEPALLDSWTRADMAREQGVDLVLALPFAYACNNAEYFARGALRILDGLGCVDFLSFGSEIGDEGKLRAAATVFADDSEALNARIREGMADGLAYPKARQNAVEALAGSATAAVLSTPNDILAVEYLKELILLNSSIKPIIVKRYAAGSSGVNAGLSVAGATAIRDMLLAGEAERASAYMPPDVWAAIRSYTNGSGRLLALDDMRAFLLYATLTADTACLSRILSATEGLENRLIRAARRGRDMADIVRFTKTKRYTETRIKRLIIHTVMGLTKDDMRAVEAGGIYGRVLAFSDRGAKLIRRVKKTTGAIPLITNPNRERAAFAGSLHMSEFDRKAADVRRLARDGCLGGFCDLKLNPKREI